MSAQCLVLSLGVIEYAAAWRLQERLVEEIAAGHRPPTLMLLEHPHTYTFGRRGRLEHLLWDEAELARRGVSVHWVDRGGDVTYHGPGQLVGYPLLPLFPHPLPLYSPAPLSTTASPTPPSPPSPFLPRADYIGYLRRLEEALIASLARLGLPAARETGLTGVWVAPDVWTRSPRLGFTPPAEQRGRPAKLAAIGVKVDARGVTSHGFALNVDPDRAYWEGIVGCGLADYPVASLADLLDPAPTMAQVVEAVIAGFGECFGFEMVQAGDRSFVDTDSN